jgi:hypothetical protein
MKQKDTSKKMTRLTISIPAKWEQYLKQLANDHQVDLDSVFSELCDWAFSNPEGKKQFKLWLDDAFPPKGEAEDKAQAAGSRERELEEDAEEESEEEAHEDENYNEDIAGENVNGEFNP